MPVSRPVRKFFALLFAGYFLLAGLLPGTNFRQLRLITNLADHFQTHRAIAANQGEGSNLLSFFWDHIVAPAEHEDLPGHSHAGLPFQGFHSGVQLYVASLSIMVNGDETVAHKHVFAEEHLVGMDPQHEIFHPPIAS